MTSPSKNDPSTQRKDGRAWAIRVLFSAGEISKAEPYFLPNGETMIGRSTSEIHDMCFEGDPAMSRQHATLDHTAGVLTFQDHSRNGSEVNGELIETSPLKSGDLIRCGDTFAVVRLEAQIFDDAPVRGLLGISAVAKQVRAAIAEVATTSSAVLLHGESGTGKGIAARAIHDLSGRDGTWMQINCAAVPEAITESNGLGVSEDGQQTTATQGPLVEAQGGTLFIDEIAELTLPHQQKLLEMLRAAPDVDTRLVTASHRDLGAEVHEGHFSLELHARLATVVIWLPPLRERIEDLLGVLNEHLADSPPLSTALVDALLRYHWPHNFREVERMATELSVRGAGYEVLVPELIEEHLQSSLLRPAPSVPSVQPPPQRQETPSAESLRGLLEHHRGELASVAAALGQSPELVRRWLAQHEIEIDEFRS
jgi:DNA-binding NtrC family response regulator